MRRSQANREAARAEALLKAIFAVLLLVSLLVGGIAGFANVFLALVVTAIGVLLFGGAGFLILRSRLLLGKKAGVIFLLAAMALAMFWRLGRLPDHWPAEKATLLRITPAAVSVTAVYNYGWQSATFEHRTTHDWASLDEAKRKTPATITLYLNPARPIDTADKAQTGWSKVTANLTTAEYSAKNTPTGVARVGDALFGRNIELKGDFLSGRLPGQSVTIYRNPRDPEQLSLEPRATDGGGRYPLLWSALALGAAGLAFVLRRPGDWIDSTKVAETSAAVVSPTVDRTEDRLRRIDWFQFEKVTARILHYDGWTVTRRGGANPDGGADLIAQRGDQIAVVQCKHWKNWEVPPKVMRELLGTKVSAGIVANHAILATLSPCTAESRSFAAANQIEVYDLPRIASRINALGLTKFPELLDPDHKECPKCGAPMVVREGTRGRFWGCTRYGSDRCRGRFDVEEFPS